jgi:hypothetical protein
MNHGLLFAGPPTPPSDTIHMEAVVAVINHYAVSLATTQVTEVPKQLIFKFRRNL